MLFQSQKKYCYLPYFVNYSSLNKVYLQNNTLKSINEYILTIASIKVKSMNNLPESEKSSRDKKTNPIKPLERPPLPKKFRKNIERRYHEQKCDERKQNILTTRFLRKKQKLLQITRQNVGLFKRINSQKSIYSHQSLKKSYQSNRSLANSRLSSKQINMRLKMSQISGRSQKSTKSIQNQENTLINRAKSVSLITRSNIKRIILPNPQRQPLVNLHQKNVQNINTEDSNQVSKLFNIKQQPSVKQRNRPIRIRSRKLIRPHKPQYQNAKEQVVNYPSSIQIVINEENNIEIHEQVQIKESSLLQNKMSMSVREGKNTFLMVENNKKREALQQDKLTNIMPATHTQYCHKNQLRLSSSQRSLQRPQTHNANNYQSLLAMKNSSLQQRLQKKIGGGVITKYKNLVEKINAELNKHKVKCVKQTTLYPYKSRLIA